MKKIGILLLLCHSLCVGNELPARLTKEIIINASFIAILSADHNGKLKIQKIYRGDKKSIESATKWVEKDTSKLGPDHQYLYVQSEPKKWHNKTFTRPYFEIIIANSMIELNGEFVEYEKIIANKGTEK